jgi:GR25 family glycosyltransferase involved in LPS biosynthesis
MIRLQQIFFAFSVLFSANILQADLQSYFKPITNKTDAHFNQVKGVDFIYLINLDQRPEKWMHCLNELTPYQIYPYRFSAVNGWELSLEDLNRLGVKYLETFSKTLWGTAYLPEENFQPHHELMQVAGRTYFCHCMSRGAVGIVLSHLSILQDAYDAGYETIWVMEDDIEIIQNPHLISDLIARLDDLVGADGWDVLFTDRDTKGQDGHYVSCYDTAKRPDFVPSDEKRLRFRGKISEDFRKIGVRYGAYSMIVRRSGMKKILDFYKEHNIFLPFDMEYYFPQGILFFTVLSDVVSTQPRAPSDNGSPGYLK